MVYVKTKHYLTVIALVLSLWACGDGPTPPSPGVIINPPVIEEPAPVVPTNITVSGTQFIAQGQPFVWMGVTAFDLPARIAEGNYQFLDWAHSTGFNLVRIVPASVHRTPRTLDDGIRQLPAALDAISQRGMFAEVVVGVDTRLYNTTAQQFYTYAQQIAEITNAYPNVVIELANENTHSVQAAFMKDWVFQTQLMELFTAPVSAGSTHGGEEPLWNAGEYMTHHADRGNTVDANGLIMAHAQQRFGKPVVDDEAIGIAAVARPGARVNDVDYGARQAQIAHQYGLAGVTLHLEAGLEARVEYLDDVQREAARRFIAAMKGL